MEIIRAYYECEDAGVPIFVTIKDGNWKRRIKLDSDRFFQAYLNGAEQRVTITNLTPADAMFKVLQVVKETYFSKKAKNKE